MDKSINNLIKMSFNLRNLTIFRKYLAVHNFQTLRSFSSSKEALPESVYSDLGDNSSTILDYIYKHQDYLSGHNWIEALRKFSECYPESSRRSKQFRDKKDVLMFCNELNKRTKTLNLSQAEEAIQLLTELGISPKSIIFQSLWKNIQTMKITSSETILQLKQDKIDPNIYSLCNRLCEAINKKPCMDRTTIHQILHMISKYSNGNIPAPSAKSIFLSCSRIPKIMLPEFAHLLTRIQDTLVIEAHSFQFKEVSNILWAIDIAQKKVNGEKFYNKQLVDSMINKFVLSDELKLEEGIDLLFKLKYLGHIHKPFVDCLVFKIFKDPMLISRLYGNLLSKLVSGLAFSDYKPPFWESIEQLVVDNTNLENYTADLILITFNLVVMNSFPHNLISRVFKLPKNVLRKEISLSTYCRFVNLYQLVKTLHPKFTGPWPSEDIFHHKYYLFDCFSPKTYPLLLALEKALGGPEYIKTKVQTKLHHMIDHVIIMRKGGFPVAINPRRCEDDSNSKKEFPPFIEDIIVPPGSQVITIIMMERGSYLRNSKQLRGHLRAMIGTLEALKYDVIPICLPEWENLNERDKIPFIMNKIRLKCPTDYTSVNI